jgi:hypothetical protein
MWRIVCADARLAIRLLRIASLRACCTRDSCKCQRRYSSLEGTWVSDFARNSHCQANSFAAFFYLQSRALGKKTPAEFDRSGHCSVGRNSNPAPAALGTRTGTVQQFGDQIIRRLQQTENPFHQLPFSAGGYRAFETTSALKLFRDNRGAIGGEYRSAKTESFEPSPKTPSTYNRKQRNGCCLGMRTPG